MNTNEISKILETIQPAIESLETSNSKEILLNLVESLGKKIVQLGEENQKLKDEINRLKGEQGKPKIRPQTKDGNISSEKEREEAERDEDATQKIGFKFGSKLIDQLKEQQLKEQQLPIDILDALKRLKGKKYDTEEAFTSAVDSQIGSTLRKKHIDTLLKYARYKKRNRSSKVNEIKVDREEICVMDRKTLPKDARPNGYSEQVIQDLIIKTDNVKFKREEFYSPSLRKSYLAPLPQGYEGEYGPSLNANILAMKYVNNMSIPKILEFLTNFGIQISSSTISRRFTHHLASFHQEKEEIYQASLETSLYQQIDDTSSRVNGKNYYTQIVCNPSCSVFFTTEHKDRFTILDILRNFETRGFIFNQ